MILKQLDLIHFKQFNKKSIKFNDGISLLAGGNNEGKSTILHALAVWEFCKTILLFDKGYQGLQYDPKKAGVGIAFDEFTPINIPTLKYLWTDLRPKSSYSLSIKCTWDDESTEKYLEFSLALANERLFIKTTASNIAKDERLLRIAYLPSFAGIQNKEIWHYPAQRLKLIGQGLSGSVLRNTIIDMYRSYQTRYNVLKGSKKRLSAKDRQELYTTDPYEILNQTMREVFYCELHPQVFNSRFHQYVNVNIEKVDLVKGKYVKKPHSKRDVMTEGSGFLQWLSVYTYALNEDIDLLLLDEPDAHLHCSLQTVLFDYLQKIVDRNHKQIFVASHSTEIIKSIDSNKIMNVNGQKCKYIKEKKQVVALLLGLGTEWNMMLDNVVRTKRILFVENDSDAQFLQIFANILGLPWPSNITIWSIASSISYRKHIIDCLRIQIPQLIAISLVDRDKSEYKSINGLLEDNQNGDVTDSSQKPPIKYMRCRKWRRSEMENYLLCKSVLARVAGIDENQVDNFYKQNHSLILLDTKDFVKSDMTSLSKASFELSGKEMIESFCRNRKCNKFDIAKEFRSDEICEDIKTILNEIIDICKL